MLTACTSPTNSWILNQFLPNESRDGDQDEMRHLTRQREIFSRTHTKTFSPVFHVKHENERIIARSTHFQISFLWFNFAAAL